MVHEVLKDLDKADFVTITIVKEELCTLSPPFPNVSTHEFLGVSTYVIGTLEQDVSKPMDLWWLSYARESNFLSRDGPTRQ